MTDGRLLCKRGGCWYGTVSIAGSVCFVLALGLAWLTSDPGQTRFPHTSSPCLCSYVTPLSPLHVFVRGEGKKKKNSQLSNLGSSIKLRLGLVAVRGGSIHPLGRMYEGLHPSIHSQQKTRPSLFSTCVLPRLTLPNLHPAPPSAG